MKKRFLITICLLLFVVRISNISAVDVDNVSADDAVLMESVDLTDNAPDAIIADVDDEPNNGKKVSGILASSEDQPNYNRKEILVKKPNKTVNSTISNNEYQKLIGFSGNNTLDNIARKMNLQRTQVLKMLQAIRSGKIGEKSRLALEEKDEALEQEIDCTNANIVTDFNTTEQSYINMHMEVYTPHGVTPELVEYVGANYGTASVSLMAFRVGVSCGEIIDTIHEIKDGKQGNDLKMNLFHMDTLNKNIVMKLKSYIIKT